MSLSSQGGSRAGRPADTRPQLDPCVRRMTYGQIRPMDEARLPLWARLFRWA